MKRKHNSLAILGGAFNPVHFGHLGIARSAKDELGYDTILFIPSAKPAHKEADPTTAAADRIAMVRLAIDEVEYIQLELCEIERGGVSFTIETLEYIQSCYAYDGRPGLIIGDDLVEGFHTWKMVDDIVEKVDLIVAKRCSSRRKKFSYTHSYLENPIIDAASSDIRRMVSRGENVDKYLPENVAQYIEERGLYR